MTLSSPATPLDEQQHIVLHGVSWEFYEQLLKELEGRSIRVTFDNGSLEMMAPLPLHERWKSWIGRMIELLALERDIEIDTLGSTTFRRQDVIKGLEPDECYYIQHATEVRGKAELDLSIDPPPDLAIEIDITRRSVPRQPVYAALGVPELWRFHARELSVLELQKDRTYAPVPASTALPFLPMRQFERFLLRMENERQTKVLREFRDWVKTLPPA